jgi:hypothetical protein
MTVLELIKLIFDTPELDVWFYSLGKDVVAVKVTINKICYSYAFNRTDIYSGIVIDSVVSEIIRKMIKEVLNEQQRKERETATQQNELL